MRNTITLTDPNGNAKSLVSVEVYEWQAASPYYGTKIGDMTEITGTGEYYIDLTESKKVTMLVDSVRKESLTGVELQGDTALADSIDTAAIQDGAITPAKTDNLLGDWED